MRLAHGDSVPLSTVSCRLSAVSPRLSANFAAESGSIHYPPPTTHFPFPSHQTTNSPPTPSNSSTFPRLIRIIPFRYYSLTVILSYAMIPCVCQPKSAPGRFGCQLRPVSPFVATLTELPQPTENAATLSLVFATLTRHITLTPLFATLTKTTGGWHYPPLLIYER